MQEIKESTEIKESLKYILTLTIACNPRGGFTLDESVRLHSINEKETILIDDITFLKSIIYKAQSNGVLSLKEAWTVYNAIFILENQDKQSTDKSD